MRDRIIEIAGEMFLNLGFKSVTMDDIANGLGVSKKTLYAHFKNKTELVGTVTNHFFDLVCNGIDMICDEKMNPIREIFEIKRLVMEHLKDEKSSPQFQLQKYYPKIFSTLKEKQFQVMHESIMDNLQRGIDLKLYRSDIDKDFIARIYFNGMVGIKDKDLFPLKNYSMNTLMNYYLDYHLRGICTTEGLQELEKQLHPSS